jgi:predicted dehydrogenase
MVNIGIVGCGKIAERHLLAYRKLGGVGVTVADVQPEAARRLAEGINVSWAESPALALTDPKIDAIDVCVPTRHHRAVVLEALSHGKHVFCEKPLCLDIDEAREIRTKAAAAGRVVMVGYLYRFHPAFRFAKEILGEGIIGQPHFALFRLGGRGSHAMWKHQSEEGGGAILEMMVHMLDLAVWYFGAVQDASLLWERTVIPTRSIDSRSQPATAEDLAVVRLQTQGVEVVCESDLLTPSYMNSVEIHGENGSIITSILHFLPTLVFCKVPRGVFNQGNNLYTFPMENLFEHELAEFLRVISAGSQAVNSVEDSIRVFEILELLEAQRDSRRPGRRSVRHVQGRTPTSSCTDSR